MYPHTLTYWQKKHGLSDDNVNLHIDWELLRRAAKHIPTGTRRWLTKHASGHCAVGRMELRRKHQNHKGVARPMRLLYTSSQPCTDQRAKDKWQDLLNKLSTWMSKHHTSPEIQSSSIKLLTNWHDFGQPLPARHISTAIAPAFLEQQEIVHAVL